MSSSLPSINLIKNKQISLFDKFMNWALTVGRLIVILTEILAMLAFIYRFSLDERLVDLHSAIKQKQALISIQKQEEDKYRNLQDRIAIAASFSEKSTKANKTIRDIISLIPSEIIINDLMLNKDKLNINLSTTSVSSLSNFTNLLKNYPEIKALSIDNIESKPPVSLSVNITAQLK